MCDMLPKAMDQQQQCCLCIDHFSQGKILKEVIKLASAYFIIFLPNRPCLDLAIQSIWYKLITSDQKCIFLHLVCNYFHILLKKRLVISSHFLTLYVHKHVPYQSVDDKLNLKILTNVSTNS